MSALPSPRAEVQAARDRLPDDGAKSRFAGNYLVISNIWEALYLDVRLENHKNDYRWLSAVYESIQPAGALNEVLWHRLGAKTTDLVHRYITDITVDDPEFASDEGTLAGIRDLIDPPKPGDGRTADDGRGDRRHDRRTDQEASRSKRPAPSVRVPRRSARTTP